MRRITLLLCLSLCIACGPKEPKNCRAARIYSKPKIDGVVEKKYIQPNNREARAFDIRQFESDNYTFYIDKGVNEDFVDFVSIHDTIRKDSNSLTYYVIKPSGKMRSFFLHWNCPDTLSLPR